MSSVLKPSLTPSVPQNSSVPSQLNKPMHPQQGPPQSYGQPSNHHSMMPHGNPAVAHNHPTTHQPNHFSLNVPNASSHYIGGNQPIPASNHPAPNNPSQPSTAPQNCSGAKNMAYQGDYQPNLGHPPNQSANQLPPISQTLPATNQQSHSHNADDADRSQSNGTSDDKTNHVSIPKETPTVPTTPTKTPSTQEKTEKSDKSPESSKTTEAEKPPQADSSSTTSTLNASGNVAQKQSSETTSSPVKEKEVTQTENSVQGDKKTTESPASANKDEAKSSSTEVKVIEDKKTGSSCTSESNDVKENEKSVLENKETEVKEKPSAPKSRAPSRKASKQTKSEEETPKVQRAEPKISPSQKSPSTSKVKRARTRTQPYQSPLPELEIISKISASTSQRNKTNDDKLTVFFKNEFLAVRNSEGSFYICQAVQNIYRSSTKIRIRWLSLDKNDKTNQIYTPDFYDNTDFDCILTNLNLERVEKGKFRLPPAEKERTDSILKRSLAAEKGEEIPSPTVTEEHPDGLDLSLYKDENQLNKRKGKKRSATSPRRSSRSPNKKSPEVSKIAKTEPKPTKKTVVKKDAALPAKKNVNSVSSTPTTSKKTGNSRTERAKRRSDIVNSTKVSPVSPKMDQKKAKALAKVARKGATAAPKTQTTVKKETKTTKPVATSSASSSTSKAKPSSKAATTSSSKRKVIKRSSKK